MPDGGADDAVGRLSCLLKALTHIHAGAKLGRGGEDGLGEGGVEEEAVVTKGGQHLLRVEGYSSCNRS